MTKLAGIIHNSVVDGPGLRTAIFFSGCRKHCPGCHNPEAQSFDYGTEFTKDEIDGLIEDVLKAGDDGITLTGGHPLEIENGDMAYRIAEKAKKAGLNIWLYTGYEFEKIPGVYHELIGLCDVVVDGPFIESLKSDTCQYRGSTNQRLIDVVKTIKQGEIVLWKN